MQRNQVFNKNETKMNKNHPEGEKNKQQAEDWCTVKHYTHDVRQWISTGLQTPGGYIGRQTRVTRDTQVVPLKQ